MLFCFFKAFIFALISKDSNVSNDELGSAMDITESDVLKVEKMYQCEGKGTELVLIHRMHKLCSS